MSLQHLNLAALVRRSQKKRDPTYYFQARRVIDTLLDRLENNTLSIFSEPLTNNEKSFLKTFLIVLRKNLLTTNDTSIISYTTVRNIGIVRAKEIALIFNVNIYRGDALNYYVSWAKQKD